MIFKTQLPTELFIRHFFIQLPVTLFVSVLSLSFNQDWLLNKAFHVLCLLFNDPRMSRRRGTEGLLQCFSACGAISKETFFNHNFVHFYCQLRRANVWKCLSLAEKHCIISLSRYMKLWWRVRIYDCHRFYSMPYSLFGVAASVQTACIIHDSKFHLHHTGPDLDLKVFCRLHTSDLCSERVLQMSSRTLKSVGKSVS